MSVWADFLIKLNIFYPFFITRRSNISDGVSEDLEEVAYLEWQVGVIFIAKLRPNYREQDANPKHRNHHKNGESYDVLEACSHQLYELAEFVVYSQVEHDFEDPWKNDDNIQNNHGYILGVINGRLLTKRVEAAVHVLNTDH